MAKVPCTNNVTLQHWTTLRKFCFKTYGPISSQIVTYVSYEIITKENHPSHKSLRNIIIIIITIIISIIIIIIIIIITIIIIIIIIIIITDNCAMFKNT